MWWREVNYWGAAVVRQAGWRGGGDQEAEGGGTSIACLLSRQARCVLTLLCRVRLLATTVVLSSAVGLCYSFRLLTLLFLLLSVISSTFVLFFSSTSFSLSSTSAHPPLASPHPPSLYPVAKIMTLLTSQTHGGSGYGPAKSSQSLTSITPLAPLFSLGRAGETER